MTFDKHLCVLLVALVGGVGCASTTGDDADVESESEEVGTAEGNWGGFTGGQCVHGVYQFYLHRFGITLAPLSGQPGPIDNCVFEGACMIWKSAKVEPDPSLFNKYEWGTVMPQTYDIVVYPPRGKSGAGHVAAVDHLASDDKDDWRSLYVMDSNYNNDRLMAKEVHTVNRAPYGFYRLKSREPKILKTSGNGAPH